MSALDLTVALCLRDDEPHVAGMVRQAAEVADAVEQVDTFEILALDERSKDNTLSVLSILHANVPELRSLQDLDPGRSIMRTARVARGQIWLIADGPFDAELARWAAWQVGCGQCAAIVPGELLAVERGFGQAVLGWLKVGLVGAQREVARALRARGDKPAWAPNPNRKLGSRAGLFVRGQLGRVGLGQYDRPKPLRLRLPGN